MLTLGLWANSMWVGVPGLRETACGCDIVDSLTGETGRSLLQNKQPSATLDGIFRANTSIFPCRQTCVLTDSCKVLYIVRKTPGKGGTHCVLREVREARGVPPILKGTNASSKKRGNRLREKNFFSEKVLTEEERDGGNVTLVLQCNMVYFVDNTYLRYTFLSHMMQGSASSC